MLKPRKRISKKELKQDQLVTLYFQANTWLENNLKYVIGAALVIVVLFALGIFFSSSSKSSNQKASVELFRAVRTSESGDVQGALTLFNSLVEKYGNTKSGKMARYYLANAFYKNQDYDNALIQYQKFSKSFSGDDYIVLSALAGVASCMEQKQQFDKAAPLFENIVKKYPKSFDAALYLLKASQCYSKANNTARANALLEKIIKEYPDSQEKNDAILLKSMSGVNS
jgi:predicted negative regulator of RcsB-dependent stress response